MILCLGATPTVQRTMIFGRLRLDAVNRAERVDEHASGKSINVARVLRELGEAAGATGFLGGETGQFIHEELRRLGIADGFVDVRAKTRTCTTVIDRAGATATELIEESRQVDPADYDRLLERLLPLLKEAGLLVCSGTLTPGAPRDFYARCAEAAAAAGVPVVLDARGAPLLLALAHYPLVAKPNRAELGETLEAPVESDDQLRAAMLRLIELGARWAVVTDGPRPVRITDGRRFWQVEIGRVELVSPIGSGDAFAAGLAAVIGRGDALPQAALLAAACGAANALTPRSGEVRNSDVQRLLSTAVRLREW